MKALPILNSAKFEWENSFQCCMIPNNVIEWGELSTDTPSFKKLWKPVGYSHSTAFNRTKSLSVCVMFENQKTFEKYWTHIPFNVFFLARIPLEGIKSPLRPLTPANEGEQGK